MRPDSVQMRIKRLRLRHEPRLERGRVDRRGRGRVKTAGLGKP